MFNQKMDFCEKVEIKTTKYYQIISTEHQKALYVSSGAKNFGEEKITLEMLNPGSLGQIWQIVEVNPKGEYKKHAYEFVHTRSTLVLEKINLNFLFRQFIPNLEENQMRLRFGKWRNSQLFQLEQVDPQVFPNLYRFSSNENRQTFMYYDQYLKVDKISPSDKKCHWEIKPCYENPIINRSCYLENAFSSLSIDVPAGSLKDGQVLIQYPLNNRFNQRFNLSLCGDYHKLSNLNSKLFLSCSKNPVVGDKVKQEKQEDELRQMWSLEYQGKNLYVIRSAVNPSLMIGIENHTVKEETPIILTTKFDFSLWRIVGYIPKR